MLHQLADMIASSLPDHLFEQSFSAGIPAVNTRFAVLSLQQDALLVLGHVSQHTAQPNPADDSSVLKCGIGNRLFFK